MRRLWAPPLILLVVLLLAFAFRWKVEATKSAGSGVVKWERDRWTARLWINVYGRAAVKRLASPLPVGGEDYAKRERDQLTTGWLIAVAGTSVWLLVAGVWDRNRGTSVYGQPINLGVLRRRFTGAKYGDLLREHAGKQPPEQLQNGAYSTLQLLAPSVREVAQDLICEYIVQIPELGGRNCGEVFQEIRIRSEGQLRSLGITPNDETIFNIFQAVTLHVAKVVQDEDLLSRTSEA